MSNEPSNVGAVVGVNLRRLRELRGLTQAEAAGELRRHGLEWTRSQVAAVETGQREDVETSTLLLLALAFDVPPADLFEGDGRVALRSGITMPLDAARALFSQPEHRANKWAKGVPITIEDEQVAEAIFEQWGHEVDQRLADRLEVDIDVVLDAARARWGCSLTEQRDRLLAEAGAEGDRRARRGHITRQLFAELTKDVQR